MEPQNWIAIVGILSSISIAAASLVFNWLDKQRQQQRDDRIHKEQQQREDLLRKEQRDLVPHIEFTIESNFYGPRNDAYLAEILLHADNRGHVQQKFNNIQLRVRGIEHGQELTFFEGYEPRLNFPIKLFNDVRIIPKGYNYFFVEPGVKQTFTVVTKIPDTIEFVLIYAIFSYDERTPHTTERVFPVKS